MLLCQLERGFGEMDRRIASSVLVFELELQSREPFGT